MDDRQSPVNENDRSLSLLESRLCREAGVRSRDSFEDVFGRPPWLHVTSVDHVEEALRTCDYFDVDPLPLDFFWKWRDALRSPSFSTTLYGDRIRVAFVGKAMDVLHTWDPIIVQWVHKHRFKFRPHHYVNLFRSCCRDQLQKHETNLLHMMDCLYNDLSVHPRQHALRTAWSTPGARRLAAWFWSHGCVLTSFDIVAVMRSGPFDAVFLQTMIENGCPVHSLTVASMASHNDLVFVKWWHDQGYPFCTTAAAWAAYWGHFPILEFLVSHQKPIDFQWTLRNAQQGGHKTLVDYVRVVQYDHDSIRT